VSVQGGRENRYPSYCFSHANPFYFSVLMRKTTEIIYRHLHKNEKEMEACHITLNSFVYVSEHNFINVLTIFFQTETK
jgi:hypothetical protein